MYVEATVGDLYRMFKPWASCETILIQVSENGIIGMTQDVIHAFFVSCIVKKDIFSVYEVDEAIYNLKVEELVQCLKNHSVNDKVDLKIASGMVEMVIGRTYYKKSLLNVVGVKVFDGMPEIECTANFTSSADECLRFMRCMDKEEKRMTFNVVGGDLEIAQIYDGGEGVLNVVEIGGEYSGTSAYGYGYLDTIFKIIPRDAVVEIGYGTDIPLHVSYLDGPNVKVDFLVAPLFSEDG